MTLVVSNDAGMNVQEFAIIVSNDADPATSDTTQVVSGCTCASATNSAPTAGEWLLLLLTALAAMLRVRFAERRRLNFLPKK